MSKTTVIRQMFNFLNKNRFSSNPCETFSNRCQKNQAITGLKKNRTFWIADLIVGVLLKVRCV